MPQGMADGRPWIDRRRPVPLKEGVIQQCNTRVPYGGSVLRLKYALLLFVGQRSGFLLSLTIV